MKKILVTGSEGFIAKNFIINFKNNPNFKIYRFSHESDLSLLTEYLKKVNYVIHLAGENRPKKKENFKKNNIEFTRILCQKINDQIKNSKKKIKLIFTSSVHAMSETKYGKSKLEAEKIIKKYKSKYFLINIFRLPGVFGKWCKPNYNSVVATFCHNIARNLPIKINDPKHKLKLVYIDDVIKAINQLLIMKESKIIKKIKPEYLISVKDLALKIKGFKFSRKNLEIDTMGNGFSKLLYSTYLSYLPSNQFSYSLKENKDVRGKFVEIFKSKLFGQMSYLTININKDRGGHYHHTKTEKFLVVKGKGLFRFRDLLTNNFVELKVSAKECRVVDTIPGWAHDIINIGSEELVVIVWANEIYDSQNPDTIQHGVAK